MDLLEANGSLPAKYHPHKLSGDMDGIWECHIQPDWLMTWEPIRNSRSSSCEQALTQACSKLSPSPKKNLDRSCHRSPTYTLLRLMR